MTILILGFMAVLIVNEITLYMVWNTLTKIKEERNK